MEIPVDATNTKWYSSVMIILLTETNGREIRGEIEEDLGDEIIFDSEIGRLIIKKEDIAEQREILNCTRFKLGTYVQTNNAIYLKIGDLRFRLVKSLNGKDVHPIHMDRIDFGKVLTHEEVFPPEEEEVITEPEGE